MKNLRCIKYFYLGALALAIFGYWIDSDVPDTAFGYQMLEVFL